VLEHRVEHHAQRARNFNGVYNEEDEVLNTLEPKTLRFVPHQKDNGHVILFVTEDNCKVPNVTS
jgi:hypothetical protein